MSLISIIDRFTEILSPGLRKDGPLEIHDVPRSAEALVLAAIANTSGSVVWIGDGPQSLGMTHRDLITLTRDCPYSLVYLPSWDVAQRLRGKAGAKAAPTGPNNVDPELEGHRLKALLALTKPRQASSRGNPQPTIIMTCIQTLMQKTCPPAWLRDNTFTVSTGGEISLESTGKSLEKLGYRFETEVVEKGQAAIRGGILDVWPATETWPARIELLGEKIESIRAFDPSDQKSRGTITSLVIPPANEFVQGEQGLASVLDYLPADTVIAWSHIENIAEHAAYFEEAIAETGTADTAVTFDDLRSGISKSGMREIYLGSFASPDGSCMPQASFGVRRLDAAFGSARQAGPCESAVKPAHSKALRGAETSTTIVTDIKPVDGVVSIPREALQPDILEKARHKLLSDLAARRQKEHSVYIFFDTDASLDHFKKQFNDRLPEGIEMGTGVLSGGFTSELLKLAIVSECDLYGRRRMLDRRYEPHPNIPRPNRDIGTRISDLADIEPGELVVHADHGIGRYRGMFEIILAGQRQEVLTIEYAEGAKLHVPVSHAHLLSRYAGASKHEPQLHRLGGKRWQTERIAAEAAIQDLAASLLETQAQRSHLPGYSFPPDTPWQHEFEAAFPYRETPDQHTTILAVKGDMESSRPMDRLVCGDAGYGKTEVAMRAAFKTVMSGRQVALLVPTTVLAQQHFDTFRDRMSAYPVTIEMLSRFVTRGQHDETLKGLAKGSVDIVIGTHALLQDNVFFKDLGLVIVDEEQRFGVAHKEKLKHIRQLVDVLTLTATPIPRTLYMSLTGARDMSLIQTPPSERMAIETVVAPNTDKVVRDALLREINRDGQVFYLHNRIATIGHVEQRIAQLVPEARIAVAHGQMASSELSSIMERFVNGDFDVLLSTTIIESGMDIPRANTILIDRADRFGIADLYQLRGRVGRSNRRAYAYLLLPQHGVVDSDARKRISAVRQHSSLGSGFALALRDLEIRGSGNILGAAQSGHISAIGFGLYCQLLKRTVARQKGEVVPQIIDVEVLLDFLSLSHDPAAACSAIIPFDYIEDERLRVSIYRTMAETTTLAEVDAVRADMRDRFGPIPPPAERLLKLAMVRVLASERGIRRVEAREGKVMLLRGSDYLQEADRFPRLKASTPDAQLDEVIRIVRAARR